MERNDSSAMIREAGLIAIIRAKASDDLILAVEAIKKGGLSVIEITLTTPDALSVIAKAAGHFGTQVLLGAGTVLDPPTASTAISAGAQFIVSPTLNLETIQLCRRYSKTVIPGCFTPNEILAAWEMGADFVKLFPASVGGPEYVRAVLNSLPQVALIPTGGVTVETIGPFLDAGAAAVAAGNSLVSQKILDEKNFALLAERASRMRQQVAKVRQKQASESVFYGGKGVST